MPTSPTSKIMIKFIIFAIFGLTVQAQQYQQQQQYTPSQQQFNLPERRNLHPPAPVHYVNIGQQLQGDYKFGYDTGKGPLGQSFREETRLPDGTVKGAYGYVDAEGRQRIIKYSAGETGFTAEGDLGAHGAKGVAPGPAPQPVQPVHTAPQQYRPPPQQQYSPPPQQQYSPPTQQHYNRPAPQQYRPRQNYEEDYNNGPAFIDTSLLTYNIGTSRNNG
ncbi:DNA-binding protein K10-like [Centruroides sculpturatus]|uniref:DNA-binding protein K10-like n=1 Tax=Centruroides sculpturatus TaxID=218467 RepID=UPI000C6D604A|nr:DNA-binding protein K10-like [Centruroides sculpturatus]XP_023240423.1 DNA-binding protein K10-like [Centruroides sculpturatus]